MSIPSPFPANPDPSKIKAFVLGCDPTAFDNQKQKIPLKTVFGIGYDGRYFAGIKANLALLNLGMDDIYVQNLIPDYRDNESSKDPDWINSAQAHIPDRVIEFDSIDPTRTIPVFLTSELLYKALINKDQTPLKPAQIYEKDSNVIIPAAINKLCRPLVILYRHPAYALKNQVNYKNQIVKQLAF